MKIKKIFLSFLCTLMMLCACGCSDEAPIVPDGIEGGAKTNSANLLYCANDTFNPYTLTTKVNMELCQLLYDSLVTLDNNFNPIYSLAESHVNEKKDWIITLKEAKFSDGSPVTAEDVIYSYSLASSSPYFASTLSNVKSIAANGNSVIFTLKNYDSYFINLLTFPIIKKDSDKVYNSDSVLMPPIGSGKYVLNENMDKLGLNANFHGKTPRFGTINLVNAPDNESISHHVEVGSTDFYYADTLMGKILRMDGKRITVNQNRLIYLGLNLNRSVFKEPKIRYSISAAIDRNAIVNTAFYGNALAATSPLNPAWNNTENYQTIETSSNAKIAIENLDEIGYNILDDAGYRHNRNGSSLEFTLLINADSDFQKDTAALIASSLHNVGIRITVRALPYESYISALESGSFQLYLAEVKINNNFDISPLIVPGGSCAYGIPGNDFSITDEESENTQESDSNDYPNDLSELVRRYKNGTVTVTELSSAVGSQMPFIPICYRSGALFYSNQIGDITTASQSDLFMSLSN